MPNAHVTVQARVPFGGFRLADNAVITVYADHDDEASGTTISVPAHDGSGRVWPQVAAALGNTRWRLVPNSHETTPRPNMCWHFTVRKA